MGSVLLLIPVRVGLKRNINQQTFMAMENMMQTPLSVGVVGGVPRRSYYIIGSCGQRLLFLDPHVATKPAMVNPETEDLMQPAASLPAVSWDRIDTSLLFGFFLKSHDDWMALTEHVRKNTKMCGIERLFCIDSDDGSTSTRNAEVSTETSALSSPRGEKRLEDCVITWDSSEED
jgi:cysteine protease ATG4